MRCCPADRGVSWTVDRSRAYTTECVSKEDIASVFTETEKRKPELLITNDYGKVGKGDN